MPSRPFVKACKSRCLLVKVRVGEADDFPLSGRQDTAPGSLRTLWGGEQNIESVLVCGR